MIPCASPTAITAEEVKTLLSSAIGYFAKHIKLINQLNVFPVPDGDTGINMYHTLQRAHREIAAIDARDVSQVLQGFAYGALMGARGNSGTIFSQLLKGFADELPATETLGSTQFASACQSAVKLAYAAVSDPVEGTILTVAREAAESLQNDETAAMPLADLFGELLLAAERSLQNTPNLLPVLRQAQVVDAGAMGLFVFLQGLSAAPGSASFAERHQHGIAEGVALLPDQGSHESYGYDLQFLMRGAGLNVADIRRDLRQMGWSVLVVGDESTVKVHIHVDNPAIPIDYAIKSGAELDDIVVENMQAQYRRYLQEREAAATNASDDRSEPKVAIVSVANGDGLRALFKDLRCTEIIIGGNGLNPSVEDFVEAIMRLPSETIIVLPNNRNIVLTARQAVSLIEDKDARVLATNTIVQGISALIAFGDAADKGDSFETMVTNMQSAAALVRSIEIAEANRSTQLQGIDIRLGDFVAIVDGEIRAASASIDAVVLQAFRVIDSEDSEIATFYYGEDIAEAEATQLIERLSIDIKGLEFELVYGGQSLYPYFIGLE